MPLAQVRIQEFGLSLRGQIGLTLYDDGFLFAQQTGRTSSALRAWSTTGQIHLLVVQEGKPGERKKILLERLTHELCHIALFDCCPNVALPSWWQEGVASVVARQERRRLSVEQLCILASSSGFDVDARLLNRKIRIEKDAFFRYALAHHVVHFCVEKVGPIHIGAFARALCRGEVLENLFHRQIKYSLDEVVAQVLRS
ncbi:MAG: hypothetical protein GY822_31350 [Deltaproteobacteria bacterium]|nr:hypothetical protein [Deltaproteobacteria bacterium]